MTRIEHATNRLIELCSGDMKLAADLADRMSRKAKTNKYAEFFGDVADLICDRALRAEEAEQEAERAVREAEALAASSAYLKTLRPDQVAAIGRASSDACLSG